MIIVEYTAKQIIYLEGQAAHSIYFIKEGEVRLIVNATVTNKRKIPNPKKETLVEKQTYEKTIRIITGGDFFGEEEVIECSLRKTRAICTEKTEIYLLKKEFLHEIFSEKEQKELSKVHEKIPTIQEVKREIKKNVSMKKLRIKTMLNVIKEGRSSASYYYKDVQQKSLTSRMATSKKNINEILLKQETFFE